MNAVTNNPLAATLLDRIERSAVRSGVIGLGYVGLPLAVELARGGCAVTGLDIDAKKVDAVMRGTSYIPDVPDGDLAALVAGGRLRATTDFSALRDLVTVNICVPTPLRKTRDPDVSYMVSAVEQVAAHLHPGMLVILESTTYPGTTEELVQPMLEATGLEAGRDFFLAFSPERVDPGNPRFHTANVPKVVGGTTETCTALATALYRRSIKHVVTVGSPKAAEMVKLLENTFRAVNIGLVNEIAMMCDTLGIDVWEVVDAAATKPFGFMPFYPGPGLGGHCIPIDPFYLSWKAKQNGFDARFIELAGQVNGHMPHYVVAKISDALNTRRKAINGARILALGVAYKRDVDDVRESPALDVMKTLQEKGADVAYSDPHVPVLAAHLWGGPHPLESLPLDAEVLEEFDCAVILTDHRAFDYELIVAHSDRIVDTRNALGARSTPAIVRLGAPLRAHGRLQEDDREANRSRRSEAQKAPRRLRRRAPRPEIPINSRRWVSVSVSDGRHRQDHSR
ncbi:MAG: nucleotide sugar dehydrogenase [Acidobacteria bacterium]|nr:nucleotide sugar dehydrogenase [Acidobacteriota bacterium]